MAATTSLVASIQSFLAESSGTATSLVASVQTFLKDNPHVAKAVCCAATLGGLVALRQRRQQRQLQGTPPGELEWLDTFRYVKDPAGWTTEKARKYGPIFKCYLFFRPTVVFGGSEVLKQFVAIERKASKSSLPATFTVLHGPYSSLNVGGKELAALHKVISAILNNDTINSYAARAAELSASFIEQSRPGQLALMPWISDYSFALFAKLFVGCDALKPGMRERFETFNDGLMGLSTVDLPCTAFGRGTRAKAALMKDIDAMLQERGKMIEGFDFAATMADAYKRATGHLPADYVSSSILLFIWGAVTEVRVEISNILYYLLKHPDQMRQVKEAVRGAGTEQSGVIDRLVLEVTRYRPPAGGGMRLLEEEQHVSVGGQKYRLPQDWVLTADPRISHRDPKVFVEPERFNPDRWKDAKLSQSPSFHPGGVGQHRCPGMPLAFKVAKFFVISLLTTFDVEEATPIAEAKFVQLPFLAIADDFMVSLKKLS